MIRLFHHGGFAAALIVCLVAACSTRLLAHPTATSFVVIEVGRLGDAGKATVSVSITTDAQSLSLKLHSLGGATTSASDGVTTRNDEIAARAGVLIARSELAADSVSLPLTLDSVTIPLGKPDQVQIVLSTTIAGTVDRLSWRTSLFSGYPVAIRSAGGPPATGDEYEWLGADDWSTPRSFKQLASVIRGWRGTATLIALGFTHIVPGGLDHVLFVLGLFLLASRTRTLLLQISVFTLAHSATLALAALGLVSVPSSIVEPLIAVSIAYIAIENLMTTSISKWRLATVFGFGLLHGLGFAGALADLGISGTDLPVTLVGFNLGVELGQLAVVVTAAVVMRLLPVASKNRRRYLTNPASAAIAAIGLFWAVERTLFN
jgi:hypothetical protein